MNNKTEQKKEYSTPSMAVVEVKSQSNLMQSTQTKCDDCELG